MESLVESFNVFAGSAKGLTARPIGPDDVQATAANLASITFKSFDESTGALVTSGSLVIADVMLTTAGSWGVDKTGYTFRWAAPGTLWPAADKRYRIQVTFTPTAAAVPPYLLAWQALTKKVF